MSFTLDHFVLNVVDVHTMLNFYTEVLGLPGERVEEFAEGKVPFPSVRISDDTVIDLFPKALWQKDNPDEVCRPNMNHFCMATSKETWQRLKERLVESGYPLKDGPGTRWGAHGSGCSIYFDDPEGNYFEIRYYEAVEEGRPCLLNS